VHKIYSNVEPNTLLHIIHRKEDFVNSREDIIPAENFLQLATLRMENKKTFRPHKHIWKQPDSEQIIAQESWVVISGKVKCLFYDLDDTLLASPVLEPGDCSITLQGGHTYEILSDDTLVYEYKTGPYRGQENDKVFLNVP
tara:strand:+ start:26 stop:448 length:423 start_codon:yes stop_codon:yes gene_type:complete